LRKFLRLLVVIGGGAIASALIAAPAFAGSISSPSGNPYSWPGDASGTPTYQNVTVTGFTPVSNVFIEQCDGSNPSAAGWDPTEHCDLLTSPSPLATNASGGGTFLASDANHRFRPFKGASPDGLFNCVATGESAPPNGLQTFTNCKIRVSSNNTATTGDQAFLTLSLPASGEPPPDTPEVPFAVALPLGAAAIGGAFLIIRKRRTAHAVG
jgi:hypothetical protein